MALRVLRLALITTGVVAVGPLTWWAAGVLPDNGVNPNHADYLWSPPSISHGLRLSFGLVSVVVVLAAAVLLSRMVRSGAGGRDGARTAAAGAAIAAYVGLTYHEATRPVYGANIGAGLLLLGGIVIVPTLVVATAVFGQRAMRSSTSR